MSQLKFSEKINAPKQKVWDILWGAKTYTKWASAFCEGSIAETDWKEGSKVNFINKNTKNGMLSRISKKEAPKFMEFEHLGEINKGKEDTTSEKAKAWSGSKESYELREKDGVTELLVRFDNHKEYEEMFKEMWPKALQRIKEISEH